MSTRSQHQHLGVDLYVSSPPSLFTMLCYSLHHSTKYFTRVESVPKFIFTSSQTTQVFNTTLSNSKTDSHPHTYLGRDNAVDTTLYCVEEEQKQLNCMDNIYCSAQSTARTPVVWAHEGADMINMIFVCTFGPSHPNRHANSHIQTDQNG